VLKALAGARYKLKAEIMQTTSSAIKLQVFNRYWRNA
jgi:hypothetical protein